MLLYIKIICFVLIMSFAWILSFLEVALSAIRAYKLKELSASTSKYRALFYTWEKYPSSVLITALIAGIFADVVTSFLISDITQTILGETGFALVVGAGCATIMILIFGEILPKSYARTYSGNISHFYLWLINGLFYLLYPIVWVLTHLSNSFLAKFVGESQQGGDVVSEKEIKFLINCGDENGIIESNKSQMLQNIFDLGEIQTKEIMVPISQIVSINIDSSLDVAMLMFAKYRFTRVPVYKEQKENIVGIVHQKDVFELLCRKKSLPLAQIVKPIVFVSQTQKINVLLNEFLQNQVHMAAVTSLEGFVAGIITLEDMIEEIVGEIKDEHELVAQSSSELSKGKIAPRSNLSNKVSQA